MRIGVVGYALNHETASTRIDARRLHLNAESTITERPDLITAFAVPDDRIPRGDSSSMEYEPGDVLLRSCRPPDKLVTITLTTLVLTRTVMWV